MARLTPLPDEESPKSHAYDATVPSASLDADPSNATARSVGVAVNDAVGGLFAGGAVTVTGVVTLSVAPLSSVTVSFTVYVPAAP